MAPPGGPSSLTFSEKNGFRNRKNRSNVMLSLVLVFLIALADAVLPQRLPEDDAKAFTFNIPSDVIFHDNKVIPEGREVSVYLPRNVTKRFFFVVERGRKPIFFVLTPCSSPLEWKIFFRYEKFQYEDDPLSQQLDLMQRPKRSKRLLQTFYSNEMMTFVSREFRNGLFILEVTARENHALANLYATSAPDVEMTYPEVNPDQVVQKNEEGAAVLAWEGSPSEAKWGQPVEYCVSYNVKKNFRSLCALQTRKRGGVVSPPIPPYVGFGFQREKKTAKVKTRKRMKSTKRPTKSSNVKKKDEFHFKCVGRRTWITLNDLSPGTPYFVDVYAINPATNRSTAYKALTFVSDGPVAPDVLSERQVLHLSLRHRRGATATFQYSPGVKCHQVMMAVLPCFGHLSVEVRRGQQLIADSKIDRLTRFRAYNVSADDTFHVHVTGDGKQSQSLKVMATRRPKRDPFPDTKDDDLKLSAVTQSITCNSVTLKWSAPDEKAVYCLYKRKEPFGNKRLFSKQNWCNNGDVSNRSEKICCRRYKRNSKQRTRRFVTETISGLHQGTSYVFDVQASRHKGETLSYQPLHVKTKNRC